MVLGQYEHLYLCPGHRFHAEVVVSAEDVAFDPLDGTLLATDAYDPVVGMPWTHMRGNVTTRLADD